MTLLEDFLVDGVPMPAPDQDVDITVTDLDAQDAGRDESGVFHRLPLRYGVRAWEFRYSLLTAETYRFLESLFYGKPYFRFTFRHSDGILRSCNAYRSNHSISLHNNPKGLYRDCRFSVQEC